MKFKSFILTSGIALSCITTSAFADIFVQMPSSHSQDLCASITGNWEGTGTVSSKIARQTIRCEYKGKGEASASFGVQTFTIKTELTRLSGLCPESAEFTVPGTCDSETGKVVLKSDEANLSGVLTNNGTAVNLTGTVNVTVSGVKVKANVERMEIHKV